MASNASQTKAQYSQSSRKVKCLLKLMVDGDVDVPSVIRNHQDVIGEYNINEILEAIELFEQRKNNPLAKRLRKILDVGIEEGEIRFSGVPVRFMAPEEAMFLYLSRKTSYQFASRNRFVLFNSMNCHIIKASGTVGLLGVSGFFYHVYSAIPCLAGSHYFYSSKTKRFLMIDDPSGKLPTMKLPNVMHGAGILRDLEDMFLENKFSPAPPEEEKFHKEVLESYKSY